MENRRPRCRLRLSTVMLLVIIAGLASYIAVLQHKERQARPEAELMRATAAYERARADNWWLRKQAMERRAGRGPTGEETKAE